MKLPAQSSGKRATSRALNALLCMGLLSGATACSDSPTDVDNEPPPANLPATRLTRSDLQTEGQVTQTPDGFTVQGILHIRSPEQQTTFTGANLRVRFDDAGRVTGISGQVQIPSPHERVRFADPVRADVGFFKGRFLNERRNLGIRLQDDTDYFVYDVATAFEMSIATGETGAEAVTPLSVHLPLGGRILMVVDYTDPMYYVYGAQDLLGSAGVGWSHNGRIPFVPTHQVADLGAFDGKNTRTGTFPVFKILSVTGQMVDNQYNEVHLTLEDPFNANLRTGYQAGYNGEMSLDLSIGEYLGIEIPIAAGSGGVWAEASTQNIFQGHAYTVGSTSRDGSWWPAFIPARPVAGLDVQAFLKSNGDFKVGLAGEYGWQLPTGTHSMLGGFELTPQAMTLNGAIRDGDVTFSITGRVTRDATTVFVTPPEQLLTAISTEVNHELGQTIADAQRAWEDLKQATEDYQFELSLRGLRSSLPTIVDAAKQALSSGIAAELAQHSGEIYYSQLRNHVYAADDRYYTELDRLKAAALNIQDNAQTRQTIESVLRTVASMKVFSTTFQYKVLGVVVKTVNVNRRIMSDANAARLIGAADNVQYIKETSDQKIRLEQIYNQVPDRQIFEEIRDDIEDGVIKMADIGELGFVFAHSANTLGVYAVIAGKRYQLGSLDAFSVTELAAALPDVMIQALRSN